MIKNGQNFPSGSPGVLQNFKNLLKTVMVRKSLRNQIWKCHFCQNPGGSTANFTESEMVFKKKKIPKEEVERMGLKNLFFCQKHRETELKSWFLATNLLQNWKKTRIMLYKVWYFSRAKKMLFALKSGQNFRSGSPGVLQNFKKWLGTVIVKR